MKPMKMTRLSLAAAGLVLAMPASLFAHRLDEYLQATRVSLSRSQITLELELTPGVDVASAIVALLDRDGDGTISRQEAGTYGTAVLKDVVLQVDGRPVPLTLTRVEIPSTDEMRDGVGTIQLRAFGSGRLVVPGRSQLYFRNNHQPQMSVYLVNALLPEDAAVTVLAQTRDARQQSVRIEYEVGLRRTAQALWLVIAAVVLLPLAFPFTGMYRTRSPRPGDGICGRSTFDA
jgi:hypothetical protein